MSKSLLTVGLLAFSSLVFAAKSYDLNFVSPTKVAGVELGKGAYTVHVEGDKAIFKGPHDKVVTVPVKLDTSAAKKFGYTSVESSRKDGQDAVKLIHLSGSTTTLQFSDESTASSK
ncbi:MAG TPA: hypothetical protein VMB03_02805 [Bryobacteraceae bacterium]|nr:hypothetical protein [Bryobacteraceae bacterium]